MKKFESPTIQISEFDIENIVTTSGKSAQERALVNLKETQKIDETNIFMLLF